MRRFLSSVLFFVSGMAIGIWGWSFVRQAVDQKHDEEIFDRQQAAHSQTTMSQTTPARPQPESAMPPIQAETAPTPEAAKSTRGGVVARLSIPKIQLRAMVREGDDDDTLDVALGHVPGTALPGQKGNVGVAGHRDRLFRRLAEIAVDDQIQMQTLSATYTYQVDDMAIVKPETVSVLAAGRTAQLTLITCYPFNYIGSAPKRYIVKAHLVSQKGATGDTASAQSGTRD
jgi:sortase A